MTLTLGASIIDGSPADDRHDRRIIDKAESAVALTYDDHVDHVGLLRVYSFSARVLNNLLALAPAVCPLSASARAIARVGPDRVEFALADGTRFRLECEPVFLLYLAPRSLVTSIRANIVVPARAVMATGNHDGLAAAATGPLETLARLIRCASRSIFLPARPAD